MTAVAGSRRPKNSNAQNALFGAGRGLFLILVAIVIGIVLLYTVDDGSSGPATDTAAKTTTSAAPVTTAANAQGGATTTAAAATTTAATSARPANQVKIMVFNAGRAAGSGGALTDQLRAKGYTDTLTPGNLPAQKGTSVACRTGFDGADAAALAAAIGPNTKVVALPASLPAAASAANCVVIYGT